jgi:uncharacterized surface anchored protein
MKRKLKVAWKRVVSGALAVVTLLSVMPTTTTSVFAANKKVTISHEYCYDSSGNMIVYADDLVWNGETINYEGRPRYKILGDGEEAYCIEPGVSLHTGNELEADVSKAWKNFTTDQKNALKLALTYGRPGNSKNLSGSADEQYVATQAIVWELVKGCRNSTGTYKRVDNTFYQAFFGNGKNSGSLKVYKEIESAMAAYHTIPSFMSDSKSDAESYELEWNGTNYSVTLTDSNKCLEDYSFESSDSSVKVSVSGNKLTLTSSKQVDAVTITAKRTLPTLSSSANLVAYGDETLQDVLIGVELPSVVKAYVKAETSSGSFKLIKTSEDGKISDVKFHLSGNGIEKDIKTGSDGTITVDDLTVGTYTITEQPEDIYVTPKGQEVTIVSGKTATVTFSNELKRGKLKVTKIAEDGLTEGITFHLYGTSKSGATVDEYAVTNKNGIATFKDILISSSKGYTLEEVDTKEYYIVPKSQKVTIEWGVVTEADVENDLKRGDVEVTKTAEDGLTEGITFHLYGTSRSGATVDEYAVTNKNGIATFKDILISNKDGYTLEEVDTAEKYVVPESQVVPVYWNEVTKSTVDNKLKKFRVHVTKKDAEKKTAQGDATLAGAVYGLYKDGTLVDTYTTDSKGEFTTSYYICGKDWILQEITPSEGYLLDETVHSVGAEEKDYEVERNTISKNVTEKVEKGSIQIVKHTDDENTDVDYETEEETTTETSKESETTEVTEEKSTDGETTEVTKETASDSETTEATKTPSVELDTSGIIEKPEAGAVFEVYLKSAGSYEKANKDERDLLTTDENGYAKTKELPYGIYTVHQIKGEEGKSFVKDFSVFINKNGKTYYFILNNTSTSSYIRVEKRDIESNQLIAASGIGFQIYDAKGNQVTQTIYYPTPTVLDTFYTNDEGWLMLPETLPYGSYQLVEVQTAQGYVLDSEPVDFTVDGTETVVTVEKHNLAQKGKIKVTKSGESFSSVTEGGLPILDKNGLEGDDATVYQPVYAVENLKGAVYEVTATEDIYTLDGTLRASKGEVVATITTDENGVAETDVLYLGNYTVTEVTAPYGMVLSDEAINLTLTYAGQEVSVTETSASFYNERQKVSVSVEKMLEVDETFGIGNRGEIQNVAFALYAGEDITASDGTVIPKDGLLEVKFCDKEGQLTFEADLPFGNYYVKEFATDRHYVISDETYPIEFTYAGQETATVKIKANDSKAIENKLLRGKVEGLKVNESEEPLEGAVFGLFSKDAESYTEETALLTSTSDTEGKFVFENLPYGDYVIRELVAPESYAVTEHNFYVSITSNDQTVGMKVVDEKITGSLEITKTDVATGKLIPNCGFEVLDADKNVIVKGYTDENGKAVFGDLEYGDYFYREFDAPEGYIIDEEAYSFSIREHHQVVKAEMTNQKIMGSLELTKKDVADGELIPNCGVEILDKDGNVVVQGKTDENGVIVFKDLEYGDYFYREYNAPEGYVIDETPYPFSISEDGQIVKAEMTNRKITGTLELTKTDVATGELLPNARFRIYDEDGNVVIEGKTDENGVATFELTYGNYAYQEYEAPEGYVIDESRFPFSIKEDGEIVKATMTNVAIEDAKKPEDQGSEESTEETSTQETTKSAQSTNSTTPSTQTPSTSQTVVSTPKTGDNTPTWYAGLLALSVVGIGGALAYNHKKKKEK